MTVRLGFDPELKLRKAAKPAIVGTGLTAEVGHSERKGIGRTTDVPRVVLVLYPKVWLKVGTVCHTPDAV